MTRSRLPLIVAIVLAVPTVAHAMPQFARKYKMPCTGCHEAGAFPRLTDVGYKFRRAGFRIVFALVASTPAYADEAATLKLFKAQCTTCHGLDGKGQTTAGRKVNVKDWTDPKVLKPLSDADVEKHIKDGKSDNGKEPMPPFAKFGDDKIKALIAYIRQFQPK